MTGEATPSAPPSSVLTSDIKSTSITIQWGPVDCNHRNGDIIGYSVQYQVQGTGSTQTLSVSGGATTEATISELNAAITYSIEVAAVNSAGIGVYSILATTMTLLQAPTVIANSTTPTTISLSWTSAGSEVDSYEVTWEKDTSGECPDADEGNATVSGSSTSYTITQLEEDSSYTINITATNAAGSVTSAHVTEMTGEAAPSAAPTSASVSDVTSSSITVQWGPVDCIHRNGDIAGYSVQYGVQGSGNIQTLSISGGTTDVVISGLHSATNYTIGVSALNNAGIGVYSDPIQVLTDSGVSVSISSFDTNSIPVSWTVTSGISPTGYIISYSNTNNTQCFTISNTTSLTGSATHYTIESLQEATQYSITVAILDRTDQDTAVASTMTAAPSAPPTSITTSDVTSSSITVQWGPVDCIHRNGDITGYSVRYGVQGSGSTQTVSVSGGATTEAIISGLTQNNIYIIEMAAANNAGLGMYSGQIAVETPSTVFLTSIGENIPTNLYVDISNLTTNQTALICRTDNVNCCSDGRTEGKWLAPSGTQVSSDPNSPQGFYSSGSFQELRLIRGVGTHSDGIYTCKLPDSSTQIQMVYVGLYREDGGSVMVAEDIMFQLKSNLNGDNPQFTLICISTGGPATTVTWTRDSETVSGGMTVFNNAVTAQYTHTLTVTGRLGGQYQCSVTNNKPSISIADLRVQVASAPTGLTAVREGPTGIRVSWTPPTPLGDTTGYRVYYSDGSSGSEDVSGGSTHNHLLTLDGLDKDSFTISIIGTSDYLPSAVQSVEIAPLGSPVNFRAAVGERDVTFSWSPSSGSVSIIGYIVTCTPSPATLPQPFPQSGAHRVSGFSPQTSYNCTVAAYTSQIFGPPATVVFTTEEDSISFNIGLAGFIVCTEWTDLSTSLKLADITRAVQEKFNSSCQCQITTDIIDEESFACFEASHNFVTYRARLSGTAERDSASFISLIEDWVSTGPTIRVRGVLMRVGEECSTAISDLSEGVCSSSGAQTDSCTCSSTGAVVGGVTAVVVVLVVAIAVVVIIALIMRHRCGHFSLETAEVHSMTDLRSTKTADVIINSNVAYELVERRGVGGVGESRGGRREGSQRGEGSRRHEGDKEGVERGVEGGENENYDTVKTFRLLLPPPPTDLTPLGNETPPHPPPAATSSGEGGGEEDIYEPMLGSQL